MSRSPTCRTVDVDGVPVLVRGQHPMTPEAAEGFAVLVRAVVEHFAAAPLCACGHLEAHHTAGRCRVRRPVPCDCSEAAT